MTDRTGRKPVAAGLARLERAGIIKIMRRLVRRRVDRVSPIIDLPETNMGTVQTTSLYSVQRPAAYADHLAPTTPGKRTRFPDKRQLTLLQRMETLWAVNPSLNTRKKPPTPTQTLADLLTAESRRAASA